MGVWRSLLADHDRFQHINLLRSGDALQAHLHLQILHCVHFGVTFPLFYNRLHSVKSPGVRKNTIFLPHGEISWRKRCRGSSCSGGKKAWWNAIPMGQPPLFLGAVSCLESFLENWGFRAMSKNHIGVSSAAVNQYQKQPESGAMWHSNWLDRWGNNAISSKSGAYEALLPRRRKGEHDACGLADFFWLLVSSIFSFSPFLLSEVHIEYNFFVFTERENRF